VDGYFEELKLAQVCIGDRAGIKLMGYLTPLIGNMTTITQGVSASNAAPGAHGLPNLDAVYTRVRLAQRVPVRIAIGKVPSGLPLVSGMTGTVTLRDELQATEDAWCHRAMAALGSSLSHLIIGASPQPSSIASKNTSERYSEGLHEHSSY
jgi:multidrug resistance efflux pump